MTFALDGVFYEIDLSAANARSLRNPLASYIAMDRARVGGDDIGGVAGTSREKPFERVEPTANQPGSGGSSHYRRSVSRRARNHPNGAISPSSAARSSSTVSRKTSSSIPSSARPAGRRPAGRPSSGLPLNGRARTGTRDGQAFRTRRVTTRYDPSRDRVMVRMTILGEGVKRRRQFRHQTVMFAIVMSIVVAFLGVWAVLPSLAVAMLVDSPSETALPTVPRLDAIRLDEQHIPFMRPGGIIESQFPDGVPVLMPNLDALTTPEVERLVGAAADRAGLGALTAQLLSTVDTHSDVSGDEDYSYPYKYTFMDSVTAQVPDQVIREHSDDLVELSSALLFAARPPAAFSLLRRMQLMENSCHVQANLALAVAVGFKPPLDAVEAEFRKAIQLCPDEPVVGAAYAKVRLAFDTRVWRMWAGGDYGKYHVGHVGEENAALAAARAVEERFPTNPIGYATEATILLEVADKYSHAGRHPFSVRAIYERSRVLLDAVHSALPDDPTVTFGLARAQQGLGNANDALTLAMSVLPRFKDRDLRYARDSVRSMDLDLGRPVDALDLMSTVDGNTDPYEYDVGPVSYMRDASCKTLLPLGDNNFRGVVGDPEPGWGGNCYVQFIDATGNQYPGGADALDTMNYIPLYRKEAPYREVLMVLANRGTEVLDSGWGKGAYLASKMQWSGDDQAALTAGLEFLQDAYRRIGALDKAEDLLRHALDSGYGNASHAADRLGEVLFLRGKYAEAARMFARAAETSPTTSYGMGGAYYSYSTAAIGPEWSTIKRAAALYRVGDSASTEQILNDLRTADATVGEIQPDWDRATLEVARLTLLGTSLLKRQAYDSAVTPLQAAVHACTPWRHNDIDPCGSGVTFNNLAVSLLRANHPEQAAEQANLAIAEDPHNPMFVEALANAFEEAGQADQAIDIYTDVIALDPSQATAHNNMGALLANAGNTDAARKQFIAAVRVQPGYGGAWFNLGLSLSGSTDPLSFLQSQGAFAHAAKSNSDFRGVDLEWFSDRQVYDPGLDLSRPLPKDWTAGAQRLPVTWSLAAIVTAVVTLAVGHLIIDKVQSRIIESALAARAGQASLAKSTAGELIGGVLCAAGVALMASRTLGGGPWPLLTGVILGLLTCSMFTTSRRMFDRTFRHAVSIPGAVIAALGAMAGVPFIPVPIAGEEPTPAARWMPYLALGGVAGLAAGLAWGTGVPVLRTTFEVVLLTIASGMIVVRPLDGSYLNSRTSRVAALVLAACAFALALRWV